MLKISWLGSPITKIDGAQIHFETRKVSALLAYLCLSPKANQREKIATLLWPDCDQSHALANLRRALGSLNRCLPPGYLQADYDTISWNEATPALIDVQEFQSSVRTVRMHPHDEVTACDTCLKCLETAADLYQGDFLDGMNLPDCPDFDEWQLYFREELRRDLAWVLEQLASCWTRRSAWDKAVHTAHRWVTLDNLAVNARLALVDIYIHSGQRLLAQRQFEEYAQVIKGELGQALDSETAKLFQQHLSSAQPVSMLTKTIGSSTTQVSSALIKSKLYLPSLKANRISRTSLLARLDEITRYKLTLISAPAGFGKTSLLADWVTHSKNLVAWLSLDRADNDPVKFFTYICAALDSLVEGICANTQAMLEAREPLESQSYMTLLLNDLEKIAQPIILVLDDYQFIDNRSIHEACTYLVERAPANFHLVIASRADPLFPLARLRAHGELLEIRTDDLRFTLSESETFFRQVMLLDITSKDIQILAGRTEGWAVGLQMAALSIRDRKDIPSFIKGFSGTNRYILDYLLEEVLASQPPEMQYFLLCSSILERLTAPLCEKVLNVGEVDGSIIEKLSKSFEPANLLNCQPILEYLERGNLFLVSIDDERMWYRYHHLFADLLRARLSQVYPGLIPKLHAQAAGWLEHNGMTIDAITHYLAAGEYDHAAHLVEENTTRLLAQGEVNALMSWIEVLPSALRLARPRLSIYQAYVLIMGGRLAEVPPVLAQVEAMLRESAGQVASEMPDDKAEIHPTHNKGTESISPAESKSLAGSIATIRAMSATLLGQNSAAISFAKQAGELLPPESLWDRTASGWALGFALHMQGNLSEARKAFEEQVRLGLAMTNVATVLIAFPDLAWLLRDQGEIHHARTVLETALTEASRKGARTLGFVARTKATLAAMLYEENELEATHAMLLDALDLARYWPNPSHLSFTYVFLARVLLAKGDLQGAEAAIIEAEQLRNDPGLTRMIRRLVEVNLVRVWLNLRASGGSPAQDASLEHQAEELVASWRKELAEIIENKTAVLDDSDEAALLTLARVAIAAGQLDDARSLLEHLTRSTRTAGHINRLIGSLVLSATIKQVRNIPEIRSTKRARGEEGMLSACAELEEALEIGQAGGYVRVFLDEGRIMQVALAQWLAQAKPGLLRDYASQLLAQFEPELQRSSPAQEIAYPIGGLVEPLTPRELEVLKLMCEGDSNLMIADKLVITVKTVKKHSGNIFGKLGVTSRAQAMVKARQLELVPKD